MAKDFGKLAQRYAKALYNTVSQELGKEGSPTPAQELAGRMLEFADLWKEEKEFSSSILNPMFDAQERLNALLAVARKTGLSELAERGLRVIFARDRTAAIPEIAQAFSQLADREAGVVRVAVIVAREIGEQEKSDIEFRLDQHIEGNVRFNWLVQPGLIGGIVVKYQGQVFDGSLNGRLERIERKLMG